MTAKSSYILHPGATVTQTFFNVPSDLFFVDAPISLWILLVSRVNSEFLLISSLQISSGRQETLEHESRRIGNDTPSTCPSITVKSLAFSILTRSISIE